MFSLWPFLDLSHQNNSDQASNTEEVTRSLGKRWIGSAVDTVKPVQINKSSVRTSQYENLDTQYQHLRGTGL